jgi:HD-like signal output (HDOD) protein
MRKRLLFVDDEAMVLDGLRRSLHGMRGEWEMCFVDSPSAALEALRHDPYDAVISDMRMPMMDGAELLEQVKQGYPSIVRIVLSGQSSRASVLRSVTPAHQFLSKPCDPQELVTRLGQAFAMRDLLSNQSLKTIVSRLRSLPSLPALYDELMGALRAKDASLVQIERIISKDIGMAAKILQLANSAFIGTRGQVSSLLHALTLIGTETVRTLVLSVHVFSQFEDNSGVDVYLPALWDHSAKVAALAQQIAGSENCTKAVVEESFSAGLLHDIGKVVLLAEMPQEYGRILQINPGVIAALELEHLGCTHAQVGAYLLSIWGLPVPLVHAVAFHDCPSESAETQFSALTAVHAAEAISSSTDMSPVHRDTELDLKYLERLGLREKEVVWRGFHDDYMAARSRAGSGGRKDGMQRENAGGLTTAIDEQDKSHEKQER